MTVNVFVQIFYPAWLVWLFVHLINLVEFENRVLVMLQWAWNYLARNRSARILTHPQLRGEFNGQIE